MYCVPVCFNVQVGTVKNMQISQKHAVKNMYKLTQSKTCKVYIDEVDETFVLMRATHLSMAMAGDSPVPGNGRRLTCPWQRAATHLALTIAGESPVLVA